MNQSGDIGDGTRKPDILRSLIAESNIIDEQPVRDISGAGKMRTTPSKAKKADPRTMFRRKDLTDREREQLFLQYYDEALKTKSELTKREQNIKELKTKIKVLENEYIYAKKKAEGTETTSQDLAFIDELRRENEQLRGQLQNSRVSQAVTSKSGKQMVKSTAKTNTYQSKPTPEHLKLIDLLQMQLKKSEVEIQNLNMQLIQSKGGVPDDVHQKNVKLATLQYRFESLEGAFKAQKAQMDRTKELLEESNQLLYDEKKKNSDLEVQLRTAGMSSQIAEDLGLQLEEAKTEKRALELKIKELSNSPFLINLDDKLSNPLRLKEVEENLAEMKMNLRELNEKYIESEKKVFEYEAKLNLLTEERDRLKDERNRFETMIVERDKNQIFFEEQLKLFNFGSDREKDNFYKALGIVKLQGENPAWKQLEFIERIENMDKDDIPGLVKEVERLKIEKSEIAAQLEKAQTLLQTHLDIEKERQIIHDSEMHKLQLQLKAANNRIEELVKLQDFRAKNYREMLIKSGAPPVKMPREGDDDEFSIMSESELGVGENTMDVLVKECELEEIYLRKVLQGKEGVDMAHIQTAIAVDFYNHDTQTSALIEGLRPNYNFQIAYKCEVTEHLINYMENESLKIELFVSIGEEFILAGTCYVPYRELLIKNYDSQYGTPQVYSVTAQIYGRKKTEIVGMLKCKMRMRHPISEALRWIQEKKDYIAEADNIEAALNPSKERRKLVVQIDSVNGLNPKIKSFVFYKFFTLKDVYTESLSGVDPEFKFLNTHDLPQTENVLSYIKNEELEFVVFDDSKPILKTDEYDIKHPKSDDIIGSARIKLSPLLDDQVIGGNLTLSDRKGDVVGSILVRVYWYDTEPKADFLSKDTSKGLTHLWEETITKKIAMVLNAKNQTLESAFTMFDADDDDMIAFDEFRWAILRIFRVEITENEVALYWKKLDLIDDKLSKKNFLLKFSPYMKFDDDVKKKDIQDRIAIVNKTFGGSEGYIESQKIKSEAFGIFVKQLAYYGRIKDMSPDYLLSLFENGSVDGFLSRDAFKNNLSKLKIYLEESKFDELFKYFDFDDDGKIATVEFKALVKPELVKEHNKQKENMNPQKKKEYLVNVAHQVFTYMRKQNINLQQFGKKLDIHATGKVTREDFDTYFRGIQIRLSLFETDAIFEEIDPEKEGVLRIDDFIKLIKPYVGVRPAISKSVQQCLNALAQYVKRQGINAYGYVDKIDSDKNGFLDRKELRSALISSGCFVSEVQVANILNYFDYGGDERISTKEFAETLEPYIKSVGGATSRSSLDPQKNLSNPQFDALKKKTMEIVKKNLEDLEQGFDILKEDDKPDFITKIGFRKTLLGLNIGFIASDVEIIMDNFVDYQDELIDWTEFLETFGGRQKPEGKMTQSRTYMSAESLFKRLSNVLKDEKITTKEAFAVFDQDGDGTITEAEFKNVFDGMKLGLTEQEFQEVISKLKKDANGKVNYNNFLKMLSN